MAAMLFQIQIQIQDGHEHAPTRTKRHGSGSTLVQVQSYTLNPGPKSKVPPTLSEYSALIESATCAAFLLSAKEGTIHQSSTANKIVVFQCFLDRVSLVIERFCCQDASSGLVYRVVADFSPEMKPTHPALQSGVLVEGPFAPTDLDAVLRFHSSIAKKVMACAREPDKATDVGGMRSPVQTSLDAVAVPLGSRVDYTVIRVVVRHRSWIEKVTGRLENFIPVIMKRLRCSY